MSYQPRSVACWEERVGLKINNNGGNFGEPIECDVALHKQQFTAIILKQ